jgi:hypothetical protein
MANTPLSVCLVQMIETTMRYPARLLRIVVMTVLLVTGSIMTGCNSGGDGDVLPSAGSSGEAGPASASLAWDPVGGVMGYIVHYGTQSPGAPGSCVYTQSEFSSTPAARVAGLAADTTYYFAVSSYAYNGLESPCSAEISTVTDSV